MNSTPRLDRPPTHQRIDLRSKLLTSGGALLVAMLLSACAAAGAPAGGEVTDAVPVSATKVVPAQVVSATHSSTDAATDVEVSTQAQQFAQLSIALVNQARRDAGLEPLVENLVLTEIAQSYSRRMADESFYGHEDPLGNDVTDRIADVDYLAQMSAENIAAGQPDPETVVEGWLNSPGHRANIMNPDLREIGAGYADTATPPYYHYWTHVFATPDASVGRDREIYPDLVLAQINELRQQAGSVPLALDASLAEIATNQLQSLVASQPAAGQIEQSFDQILEQSSEGALPGFQQILAMSAAGPSTPEEVLAMWIENDDDGNLIDPALRAAGVAYVFAEEDDFRHYWLLLLGG